MDSSGRRGDDYRNRSEHESGAQPFQEGVGEAPAVLPPRLDFPNLTFDDVHHSLAARIIVRLAGQDSRLAKHLHVRRGHLLARVIVDAYRPYLRGTAEGPDLGGEMVAHFRDSGSRLT